MYGLSHGILRLAHESFHLKLLQKLTLHDSKGGDLGKAQNQPPGIGISHGR